MNIHTIFGLTWKSMVRHPLLDKGKIIKDSRSVNNELREELNSYFRL